MKIIKKTISQNPLFYAFVFPGVVDVILTLVGQDSQSVNEASPAYYFLLKSRWLFAVGSIVWFVVLNWIFKNLKESIKLWLMFLFITSHSWGSASWIWKIARDNSWYTKSNQVSVMLFWGLVILYFTIVGLIASHCTRIYFKKGENEIN